MQERAFGVAEAVDAIGRATSYDLPLRRRTESATWVVWALATALMPASYATLFELGAWSWGIHVLLSVGWPVVGLVAVGALWRVAGITDGGLAFPPRRLALSMVAFAAAVYVSIELGWRAGLAPWGWLLFFALAPWALLALVQWRRLSAAGRRWTVGVGIAVGVAVAGYEAAVGYDVGHPSIVLVYAATAAGIPFVVGLWRALRG